MYYNLNHSCNILSNSWLEICLKQQFYGENISNWSLVWICDGMVLFRILRFLATVIVYWWHILLTYCVPQSRNFSVDDFLVSTIPPNFVFTIIALSIILRHWGDKRHILEKKFGKLHKQHKQLVTSLVVYLQNTTITRKVFLVINYSFLSKIYLSYVDFLCSRALSQNAKASTS